MTRNSMVLSEFERYLREQSAIMPNQQPHYVR